LTGQPDQSYRCSDGLVIKSWDEEFAVAYAATQAKTLLISAAAATVLQLAKQDAVTVVSLLPLYAPDPLIDGSTPDAAVATQDHLRATLDGLLSAGLLVSTT
jgi:hypothetical protein